MLRKPKATRLTRFWWLFIESVGPSVNTCPYAQEVIGMPKVGDRVQAASSRAGPRSGVVRRVSGRLITIQWDSGEESTLIPGPGVLKVVGAVSGVVAGKEAAATTQ